MSADEVREVTDPTWNRVVQIESMVEKLLKGQSELLKIQKRIEEKIDRQEALDTQFSGLGLCLPDRTIK